MGEVKRKLIAAASGHAIRNCGTCAGFRRYKIGAAVGTCHGGIPAVSVVGMQPPAIAGQQPRPITYSYWPEVSDTEFCLQWQPREAPTGTYADIDLSKLEALEQVEVDGSA